MSLILTILGLIGAILILMAYIQVSRHHWKPRSSAFQVTNLVGSVILIGYSLAIHAYPIALLNVVWAVVALRNVLR